MNNSFILLMTVMLITESFKSERKKSTSFMLKTFFTGEYQETLGLVSRALKVIVSYHPTTNL